MKNPILIKIVGLERGLRGLLQDVILELGDMKLQRYSFQDRDPKIKKRRYEEVWWQGSGKLDTIDGTIFWSTWGVIVTKGTYCIFIFITESILMVWRALFL